MKIADTTQSSKPAPPWWVGKQIKHDCGKTLTLEAGDTVQAAFVLGTRRTAVTHCPHCKTPAVYSDTEGTAA